MTIDSDAAKDGHTLSFTELVDILARVFERHGTSSEVASVLADNCARAERDGAKSHGVFRVPGYLSTLKSGYVNGHAQVAVESVAGGFIRVDAGNGFAQPALARARQPLMQAAAKNGIALAAIRNSHHFGALWQDVEPFASEGFIALACVNATARMVPCGGHSPVYGTNPLAFAAPRAGRPPLVFDLATSALAFGEVRLAAMHGQTLPQGCGVDRDGVPTTDASRIVDGGSLLPFGGYKGASIAMMVELLSAALTGGALSTEIDQSGHPGAQTSRAGQTVILIDANRSPAGSFADRVNQLCETLKHAGQARLPSGRRYANRAASDRDGIYIDAAAWQTLAPFLCLTEARCPPA